MNGRVYDYNLGRFMSVDPLIQSPTSTQSINPYSYIMNNPLAGTDPTGYCSTDDSVAGCSDSLGEGESSDITEGGKVVGTVGKDSQGNMYITKSNGNAGHQAIQGAMGKAGDVSKVGSLEGNAAKGGGTNEQEKNGQGTHIPQESNTTPKERKELEDKLSSLNIKARVANKNGGFERRDDAAAWYHNNVNSLAVEYDTEIGAEIFKNSYWTGEELVDRYYLGDAVTTHMRNQVNLSGSVNNSKLNISGRWHSHGPDSAPFTIGADTNWADQNVSRASYLSRANNYLLTSYVLQKYSKGAEVNICGTKC